MKFSNTVSRFWQREGLKRRIEFFFVGFVLIVALLYAYASIWAIEFTEASLITRVMEDEIVNLQSQLDNDEKIHLAAGYRLYGYDSRLSPVPDYLLNLPEGYNELETSPAIFVMRQNRPEGDLFLTLDQEKFEADEQLFIKIIGISLIGILLIAFIFVNFLSQLIFRPVEILTDAVKLQMSNREYHALGVTVSNDEIGHLANMCDRALKELHEALDREKAFTGDVSHELRTPLTVIRTSAELLELQNTNDYAQAQIGRILKASDTMQELIDLFLEFSRARNTQPLDSSVNRGATLGEIAEELEQTWSAKAKEKGLCFSVSVNTRSNELYPSLYLKTVLSNLIRNAMSYTPKGGVLLYIEDNLCLLIDSGPGIAKEDQARIFFPFERGSASIKHGNGVGLGLSIVLRMADRLGWRIELLNTDEFICSNRRIIHDKRFDETKIGAVFALHLAPIAIRERKRKDEMENG